MDVYGIKRDYGLHVQTGFISHRNLFPYWQYGNKFHKRRIFYYGVGVMSLSEERKEGKCQSAVVDKEKRFSQEPMMDFVDI